MFKLAELFVDIRARDDEMKRQMGALKGQMTAMGTAIGTAAGTLAASAISSATSAIAGFFSRGIGGAIELQDVLQATGVIFGDSASIITKQADEMAKKFGTVKGEYIQAAQAFGSVFKGAGSSQADAAKLGNQLTQLGMDLASFKGGTTTNAEAFTALQAALRGEFDPLERFNVFLTAATVTEKALSMGLIKSAKDMDESAKKTATLALIMGKTVDQQGDLSRTSDQTHNSWAKLTGTLTNMAEEVGETLMPAIDALIGLGGEMVSSLAAGFESSKESFRAFSDGVVDVAKTIGVVWRNLPEVWNIVQVRFREMFANMIAALVTLPENAQIIGSWFGRNWVNLLQDAFSAATEILTNFGKNIYALGESIKEWMSGKGWHFDPTPLLKDFEAVTEKLPEMVKPAWVSLEAEFKAASARIADNEASGLGVAIKKAGLAAKGAAGGSEHKVEKFKSETIGVADFSSRLRETALGRGDDTAKKQLDEQKKTREATEKIAKAVEGNGLVAVLG